MQRPGTLQRYQFESCLADGKIRKLRERDEIISDSGRMVCVVSSLLLLKNNNFSLNLPGMVSTRM